jgi:hypothetical protein
MARHSWRVQTTRGLRTIIISVERMFGWPRGTGFPRTLPSMVTSTVDYSLGSSSLFLSVWKGREVTAHIDRGSRGDGRWFGFKVKYLVRSPVFHHLRGLPLA